MENKFDIPEKLWKSFKTDTAKRTFVDTYFKALDNQSNLCHPHMDKITNDQWKTICWNLACIAAWSISKSKGDEIEISEKGMYLHKNTGK